jgi:transcriptional regulator with XRE-family HTH domain
VSGPISENQLRLVTESVAASPSVYFSGPLTWYAKSEPAKLDQVMEVAETVEACLLEAGMTVHIPHRDADHSHGGRTYWQNRVTIAGSDLVVAYYDLPSTGMGQELEIASAYARPVILLINERRAKISTMVSGAYFQAKSLIYDDLLQLAGELPPLARELIDCAPEIDLSRGIGTGLGATLSGWRARLGMSRDTLAERAGCSAEMIRHLEEDADDVVSPSLAQLEGIAQALGITSAELLGIGGIDRREQRVVEFAARSGRSAEQALRALEIAAREVALDSDGEIARLFEVIDSIDEG